MAERYEEKMKCKRIDCSQARVISLLNPALLGAFCTRTSDGNDVDFQSPAACRQVFAHMGKERSQVPKSWQSLRAAGRHSPTTASNETRPSGTSRPDVD
jgi:hypothetical protein